MLSSSWRLWKLIDMPFFNIPWASGLGRLANRGGGPSLKERGLEGVFQLQGDHNPCILAELNSGVCCFVKPVPVKLQG